MNFCMPIESDNGSEDDVSYSVSSEPEFYALEEEEYDEEDNTGVMEMVGNQIIPIEILCQMNCKKIVVTIVL